MSRGHGTREGAPTSIGRNHAAICVLGVVLNACSGTGTEAPATPASTVRDSSGVTIVENAGLTESHQVSWAIGSEPVVSIGTLEGDERYQLFRVVDALVLNDGRIAVANRGTSEIRTYDPEGRYLDSWGVAGEGPGEFTGLARIARWPGDSLLAWDFQLRRATVFDPEGAVGRSFSLASDDRVTTSELVAVFPGSRLLIRGSFLFGAQDITSGLQRLSRPYGLAGATGEIVASFGDHPAPRRTRS
jgi:hypothetical protein